MSKIMFMSSLENSMQFIIVENSKAHNTIDNKLANGGLLVSDTVATYQYIKKLIDISAVEPKHSVLISGNHLEELSVEIKKEIEVLITQLTPTKQRAINLFYFNDNYYELNVRETTDRIINALNILYNLCLQCKENKTELLVYREE
jgi:hypothetical protein